MTFCTKIGKGIIRFQLTIAVARGISAKKKNTSKERCAVPIWFLQSSLLWVVILSYFSKRTSAGKLSSLSPRTNPVVILWLLQHTTLSVDIMRGPSHKSDFLQEKNHLQNVIWLGDWMGLLLCTLKKILFHRGKKVSYQIWNKSDKKKFSIVSFVFVLVPLSIATLKVSWEDKDCFWTME